MSSANYVTLASVKWQRFQECLARILQITIGDFESCGLIHNLYNSTTEYDCLRSSTSSLEYREFLAEETKEVLKIRQIRFIRDPFGNPTAIIARNSLQCSFLVASFPGELSSMEDFKMRLAGIDSLYGQIELSFHDNSTLGQQMMLLTAVEEINKLMVGSLDSSSFDLENVLQLVASSLVILFDADAACVFTSYDDVQPKTAICGEKGQVLEELKQEWETAVGRAVRDQKWCDGVKGSHRGVRFEPLFSQRGSASVMLGVVNASKENVRAGLSAFSKQVSIAMEVAFLYQALQSRVSDLLGSLRQGVVVTNREGVVMVANRAVHSLFEIYGASVKVGSPIGELAISTAIDSAIERTLKEGAPYHATEEPLEIAETTAYFNCDLTPVLWQGQRIVGSILMLEDVSEKVSQRQQMREWERLATAGRLAAGLAHEIRNPLTAATAALQFTELVEDDERRSELLAKVSGELDRMNKILTDFLSFAKPSEQDEASEIDLRKVIADMHYLLKSQAHFNNIDFVCSPVQEPPLYVIGDTNGLKQVFLNVAKNAIEALGDGGRLSVSLSRKSGRIWVDFTDNGPGIPAQERENIFRPFYTTKITGTGLGLSVSLAIVQGMGGEILVESEVGEGTVVHIVLPESPGRV